MADSDASGASKHDERGRFAFSSKPSLTPKPGAKPVERDPHPPGKKNDKKTR